jgi:hypothetical protein
MDQVEKGSQRWRQPCGVGDYTSLRDVAGGLDGKASNCLPKKKTSLEQPDLAGAVDGKKW